MQHLRTRLICRAHNRFTPSIAWWQHFVVPSQPRLQKLRHASSTAEAVRDREIPPADVPNILEPNEPSSVPATANEAEHESHDNKLNIQRVPTGKGIWFEKNVQTKEPLLVPATANKTQHGSQVNRLNVQRVTLEEGNRSKKYVPTQKPPKKVVPNPAEALLDVAKSAFDEGTAYEGVVVRPVVNPQPIKESQLPWCLLPEERNIPGIERLEIEIARFGEHAAPSRYESVARKDLIERIERLVYANLPNYTLEVFGSERTGIALATSDIDFRLAKQSDETKDNVLPPSPELRSEALRKLHRLKNSAFTKHPAFLLPTVRYARYPLLSLQDRKSGLDVQIVSNNDTIISRQLISGYMAEYPYLQHLYYVVKTLMDIRGLSDVFRGGFGSYSLFMMVVASLRHNPHPRDDAAGGLINFLKFWSEFDTEKHGVSIEPVALFDKESEPVRTDTVRAKLQEGQTKPLPAYMLCLRDPADEHNDLGRKGVAIKHVQATLRALSKQLETDIETNVRPSLLGPVVGACYMLNRSQRRKLEAHGGQVAIRIRQTLKRKAMAIRNAQNSKTVPQGEQAEESESYDLSQKEESYEDLLNTANEEVNEMEGLSFMGGDEETARVLDKTSAAKETSEEDDSNTKLSPSTVDTPLEVANDSRAT